MSQKSARLTGCLLFAAVFFMIVAVIAKRYFFPPFIEPRTSKTTSDLKKEFSKKGPVNRRLNEVTSNTTKHQRLKNALVEREPPKVTELNARGPKTSPLTVPKFGNSENEELQTQKEFIQSTILEMKPRVKKCYEKSLIDFPESSGRVVIGFEIRADEDGEEGRVEMSELDPEKTTLFDQKLHDCMLGVISEIRVDAPTDGVLRVNYPFNFTPE